MSIEFSNQTLVSPYNIQVYITRSIDHCNINNYLGQVSAFNIDIYVLFNEINFLTPVTCRYRLPPHSAVSAHNCYGLPWF